MNIAIITNFHYHFECIGFLLELLSKNNNIYIHYNNDSHKYIDYFQEIYNFNIENTSCKENLDKYDLIIMLSSNDSSFYEEAKNKTIGILHLGGKGLEKNVKNFITLWPSVKPNNDLDYVYTLPIYKGLKNKPTNTITYVGYFGKDYFDKDLIEFVENANFTFNFIIYGYDSKVIEKMKEYSNINQINQGISANELINMINSSKFILCRRWPYQKDNIFSGMISLGLSHNVPMILQNKTNRADIPCIKFKDGYSSVIDKVNNISDEEYNDLKKEMDQFCDKTISENKINIMKYIDKVIN